MKKLKLIFLTSILLILAGQVLAENGENADPNKLFYSANALYEKRDYDKALDEYAKIPDMGIHSGSLYYNMGNSYFKLGKLGYAILYYEKAKRLTPQDSDLKQNLIYARSLIPGPSYQVPQKKIIVSLIKAPFKEFNLNALTVCATAVYVLLVLFQLLSIFNPVIAKKIRVLHAAVVVVFILGLGAFALRYYDDEFLKRGIVVSKSVDCKYEPIDKSTTFYKLQEGDDVLVLKTREGWTQVKRADGKIGWVKQGEVGEV